MLFIGAEVCALVIMEASHFSDFWQWCLAPLLERGGAVGLSHKMLNRGTRTDTNFGCPVIGRRDLLNNQKAHRDKLQKMKSTLDTSAPTAQPHLTLYGRDYVAKKRATTEAAFSDLKMIQSIARTMTRKDQSQHERKGPASLNADGRRADIYRIMKENHTLLDNIEGVAPFMRTQDSIREYDFKKRYVINGSHSMRLSGGYDDQISKIRLEESSLLEEKKRSTTLRRERLAMRGSVSLPSLSPNGQRGMETPPPAQSQGGLGAAGRGRGGGSSSSSGFNEPSKGRGRGHGNSAFSQTAPGSIAAASRKAAPPEPPAAEQQLPFDEDQFQSRLQELKSVPEPPFDEDQFQSRLQELKSVPEPVRVAAQLEEPLEKPAEETLPQEQPVEEQVEEPQVEEQQTSPEETQESEQPPAVAERPPVRFDVEVDAEAADAAVEHPSVSYNRTATPFPGSVDVKASIDSRTATPFPSSVDVK
ncbi:unnamed protein product, partial [Polarella glacialis]